MVIEVLCPGFYRGAREVAVAMQLRFPDYEAQQLCDFFDVVFGLGFLFALWLVMTVAILRSLFRPAPAEA